MAKTYTPPAPGVNIQISSRKPDVLSVQFQTAPEKGAPGQPGPNAGDITFLINTILVSLGKPDKINAESWRAAGGRLANWLLKNHASNAQIDIDQFNTHAVETALAALCEGLLLGSFRFDRYKSSRKDETTATVYLATGKESQGLQALLDRIEKITAAVNLARDWAHEPANVINPVTLAERVTELAHEHNLKVTVIDDSQLAEMGAGAILAVGKGSRTPSRLIILEYPGDGVQPGSAPLAVIGKAITFDTGGYSLKDSTNIRGMKYDKSGAMAVVGILQAAAELKLKTPVTGVIAAAENMVSDHSYRPDDILTTLSGKTVEIISTDAEGRLVLSDALTYTQKNLKPRAMVDLATLTGGVVVALGTVRAGIMSNNNDLAASLSEAGEATHERLWRLPLDEEYEQQIKSDDADIKNSGGREASAIIGGTFLKEFVDPQIPWAHIDIAGTADTSKEMPYCPIGATGFGIRLILDYLERSFK